MLELPGYIIERQIGKGGMARVYLAVHESLHREVAIKVMSKHLDEDAGFGERFMREARIVANLNHQNIVTVHDVATHDGHHYIAMEYLPGGITLDQRIKQGIKPADGVITIRQVASALGFAHGKGIVHRDVKPDNIMYREDGAAVLTDFGIARSTTSVTRMTATGTVIGTPHYMSPEQAQGEELGPGADIYSLGVVLYETLTGEVPYDADSSIAIIFKHITDPVPTLAGELAVYQPLLERMMAKDKASRYQDCADIIADLDSLVSGGPVSKATLINNATAINPATPAAIAAIEKARGNTAPQEVASAKKSRLMPALAATIVVAAAAAGYVLYDQNQGERKQQRFTQTNTQQEQKLFDEKQQLANKLAAEKAGKESAEKLRLGQLKAQQLTAEISAAKKKQAEAEPLDTAKLKREVEAKLRAEAEQKELAAQEAQRKADKARAEKDKQIELARQNAKVKEEELARQAALQKQSEELARQAVEKKQQTEALAAAQAGNLDVSGRYNSEIVSRSANASWIRWLFGRQPEVEMVLKQNGAEIKGDFSGSVSGSIEGTRTGSIIKYKFYTVGGNGKTPAHGSGTWTISADGSLLQGKWRAAEYEVSGTWQLSRL